MVLQELGESNAPPNMVMAFKQLRVLYGEPLIPLKLGTDFHGGHTDMTQIEVGIDHMYLTILPNHHNVPDKFKDSAAFFVVGHEFGHIVAHPGKEAKYWKSGARELPVEHFQKGRWFNAISDIIVNWTVITGTGIQVDAQIPFIQPQMLAGWQASSFLRHCDNIEGHGKLLEEGKLKDNRYCPAGGLVGQYDNADPKNPYVAGLDTPFWQTKQGHGRGEQYYPPIGYSVAANLGDNYRKVMVLKSVGSLVKGRTYVVEGHRTYDNREDSKEWEPIKDYKINGEWIPANKCVGLCPDCGEPAPTIWDRWWNYKSKEKREQILKQQGSWTYLVIQMFAFEWAAVYSTYFPYGNKRGRNAGKQFLKDIADEMDNVMRSS
tara:strand:- start:5781 stop:6908 length:1128 start_codon:yes stop_codon:yes gene_type:complete